jgi:hypothetical protein
MGLRLLGVLSAAIAVALVLNAVICFLPENSYQRWKLADSDLDGRMRWIYERIHYDPRPIDVAILGGSGAQVGFSAPEIERKFAKQGQDANVVNFAIFGRGRNIESVILEEIYKAKSPRAIVVEVFDPPYPFGHDLFRYVASAGAIVSAPKLTLHTYFDNLAYLPVRKLTLVGANLFPNLFGLSKQFAPEHYAQNRIDYSTNFVADGEPVDMEHPVPRNILLEQVSQHEAGLAGIAREYARFKGGEERVYIRQMAHEAKAHGTQIIFAYIPNFSGSGTLSDLDFLKQYGPVLNYGDLAPRDELFENWAHLNHAGAQIASARLADEIQGPASNSLDNSPIRRPQREARTPF